MADADRERLIETLKIDPCPSPYLCGENCKYANLERCYEERTADLLLEHGIIVPPCKVIWYGGSLQSLTKTARKSPTFCLARLPVFPCKKRGFGRSVDMLVA